MLGLGAIVFSVRRMNDLNAEIDRREAAEDEANRLARHDALTGLPNRRQFEEEFVKRTGRRAKDARPCALFMVDLDHFKPVNDVYGHVAGDVALRVVAERLVQLVGEEGIVARLGGDEFALLLPFEPSSDAPMRLARRIVHELAGPIMHGQYMIKVGASVGVALYPNDGRDLDTLLRQADIAMYAAKSDGRGTYHFFERRMDERLRQRMALERELITAIADGEIVPYYQPLVDLATGKTLGYEMLARWKHPERGLLLPSSFIPIAEDTGLIGSLTYSLLRRACRDAKDWDDTLFLAINLAPSQLVDPWLSQEILGILAECSFPARRLEIEITETALVQKLEQAKVVIESLRNLGVRVALDDFGTGYSGLHHLRDLQLDTLKIDRSFITDMLARPEQARIVEAILGLSKALGLQATAEGIETPEILQRLTALGCQMGQGYYLGVPQPAAEIRAAQAAERRRLA